MSLLRVSRPPPPGSSGGDYSPLYHESEAGSSDEGTKGNTAPSDSTRVSRSTLLIVLAVIVVGLIGVGIVAGFALGRTFAEGPLVLPEPPIITKKRTTVTHNVAPSPLSIEITASTTAYLLQFPTDLSDYVGRTYSIYSNHSTSALHQVHFTSSVNTVAGRCGRAVGPTFDQAGQQPGLQFEAGGKDCHVTFRVVECGEIAVIGSHCASFCDAGFVTCTGPTLEVAQVDVLFSTSINTQTVMTNQIMTTTLAHIASGVIPPTHAKQTLANDPGAPPTAPVVSLAATPLGVIAPGAKVAGGTLLFQAATGGPWEVRDLAADVYTSVSDAVGTRVIQGGLPETFGGASNCGSGSAAPSDGVTSTLKIFSGNFLGGVLTLNIRSGSELAYDFVSIKQNGVSVYSVSGAGPIPSNAFIEGTVVINMQGTDIITVEFTKDGSCWGGYDVVYVYATLSTTQNLDMTLPSDMSAYAGKNVEICSLDTGSHTLTLEGSDSHFDSAGMWQTLQFRATGADACCATLSFLSANKLSVVSRDPCTVFCNNASLLHCVDPLRPASTSPFHGYWKAITKSFQGGSYAFVDASTNPMSVRVNLGDVISPQEQSFGFGLYPVSSGTFSSNNDINIHDPSNVGTVVTFQPGGQEFVIYTGRDDGAFEISNIIYSVFEKTAIVPPIVPTGPGTLTPLEPEDPEALFRNYVQMLIYQARGPNNVDDKWIGYYAANALMESLISTGTGPLVTSIVETRVTQSFNLEGITEFRTDVYHHVVPPSRVIVAGFTGLCTALNGDHMVVVGATNNVPAPGAAFMDYGTNASARTVHHKIGVFLDSSSIPVFPGTQIANCTGSTPTITVSYGPVNSATNYIRTMGAINYWFYEALKVSQHCALDLFFDASTTVPRSGVGYTWEEWSDPIADLVAGPDPDFFKKRIRSRHVGDTSSFYPNGAATVTNQRFFSVLTADNRLWLGNTDLTGRFGIRPDVEASIVMFQTDNSARSTHWISIPRHNYLESAAYPAFKMTGTTRTHPLNLAAQLSYPGGGGDEFDTLMVPFGDLPPADYSYVWASALPNGGYSYTYDLEYNFVNEINQEALFVGRIKQAYTSGLNIGYIRFEDSSALDPLYLSVQAQSCPTGLCDPSSYRLNREALTSIYGTYMQYLLVDLDCDHIILDIRGNGGGTAFSQPVSREFFGAMDDIPVDYAFASRTDNGNGASVDLKTLSYGNNVLTASVDNQRVSPLASETAYPGSVLTEGEVVFLTNTDAASGGDIFPNFYLGPAFDGQLGNNTQASMIGSIDGRLKGYSCGYSLPTSRDSPRLKTAAGAAYPVTVRIDCGSELRRGDGTNLANQHPALEIDSADGATGLAGGNPLPQDWDELVYKDLGYVTNTRTVMPGWTGPQTPSNIVETNPLSTTSGSSIVTVTTAAPHGFATGDDVALGSTAIPVPSTSGISSNALTGGHIITVTGPTTFTFDAVDVATYPGFAQSNATATASGVGGSIRVANRSQWRDMWLEQSVATIVAQAKKKRSMSDPAAHKARKAVRKEKLLAQREARKARLTALKKRTFDARAAKKMYGRDVSCPSSEGGKRLPLTPLREVQATRNVTFPRASPEVAEFVHQRQVRQIVGEVAASIKANLASGGMCLDSAGALMATPTVTDVIKIVPDGRHATVDFVAAPPCKKTAKGVRHLICFGLRLNFPGRPQVQKDDASRGEKGAQEAQRRLQCVHQGVRHRPHPWIPPVHPQVLAHNALKRKRKTRVNLFFISATERHAQTRCCCRPRVATLQISACSAAR